MDTWDLTAMRTAAAREQNAALRALLARLAAWVRFEPAAEADPCHSCASR